MDPLDSKCPFCFNEMPVIGNTVFVSLYCRMVCFTPFYERRYIWTLKQAKSHFEKNGFVDDNKGYFREDERGVMPSVHYEK